jgi:thioredoxin-like negative regulator of GroEL
MATEVQDLTRDSLQKLVTEAEQPGIIDFWGPQCAPCLALAPVFHDLASSHRDMTFLRVEAPSNRMLCVDLKVMSLPTFLCLVGGVEVGRVNGDLLPEELTEWVHEQAGLVKGGEQ